MGQTFAFGKCRPRRSPEIAESGNRACTQLATGHFERRNAMRRAGTAARAGACDRRVDNHARRHANGAPHPEASAYARMFSGKYEHRLISGGIGHNLPQEAPEAFARGHHRRERNVIRARQSATAS